MKLHYFLKTLLKLFYLYSGVNFYCAGYTVSIVSKPTVKANAHPALERLSWKGYLGHQKGSSYSKVHRSSIVTSIYHIMNVKWVAFAIKLVSPLCWSSTCVCVCVSRCWRELEMLINWQLKLEDLCVWHLPWSRSLSSSSSAPARVDAAEEQAKEEKKGCRLLSLSVWGPAMRLGQWEAEKSQLKAGA